MNPAFETYRLYQRRGVPLKFFQHLRLCNSKGFVVSSDSVFLMAAPHTDSEKRFGWFVYGAYSKIGIKALVKKMPYYLPYLFWWRHGRQQAKPYSTGRILKYVS